MSAFMQKLRLRLRQAQRELDEINRLIDLHDGPAKAAGVTRAKPKKKAKAKKAKRAVAKKVKKARAGKAASKRGAAKPAKTARKPRRATKAKPYMNGADKRPARAVYARAPSL